MPWVKAEYAGELAVVSAWVAALLPWSVSLLPEGPLGSILFMVRWPLLELQVRIPADVTIAEQPAPVEEILAEVYPGVKLFGSFYVTEPVTVATHYGIEPLFYGGLAWLAGAAVVVVAVALSLALYRDEAGTTRRLPVDPVRGMAGLLGLAALAFAVASAFYWQGQELVGIPVPIGVLVVGALAVVLARVERV